MRCFFTRSIQIRHGYENRQRLTTSIWNHSKFSTTADDANNDGDAGDEVLRVSHFIDILDQPAFISSEATVSYAIDELVSMRVGTLLTCSEGGEITGILTIRDLLRQLAGTSKEHALRKPVRDILTPASRIIYCRPSDTLREVRLLMRSHSARNIPVLGFRPHSPASTGRHPDSGHADGEEEGVEVVLGMMSPKVIASGISVLMDGAEASGGKGASLKNLEEPRRGLPGLTRAATGQGPQWGVSVSAGASSASASASTASSNSNSSSSGGGGGSVRGGPGGVGARTLRGKVLDVVAGAFALPHPFKSRVEGESNVSQTRRDFGPGDEVCMDVTLSEDAHFTTRVHWPAPHPLPPYVTYAGVADGVGSWREVGVDPRNFSQRLMTCAHQYVHQLAPMLDEYGEGRAGHSNAGQAQTLAAAAALTLQRLLEGFAESSGEERVAEYKRAFDEVDSDGNGELDKREVATLIARFNEGNQPSSFEVDAFLGFFDRKESGGSKVKQGTITWVDFSSGLASAAAATNNPSSDGSSGSSGDGGGGGKGGHSSVLSNEAGTHEDLKTPLPLSSSWWPTTQATSSSSPADENSSLSPLEFAAQALALKAKKDATLSSAVGWGKVRLVQMAAGADASWLKSSSCLADPAGGLMSEDGALTLAQQNQLQQLQQGQGPGQQPPSSLSPSYTRPPTPLEILDSAWEMVVSERVEGSCTACVVTLDGRLNQLSYANLGDSGVILLRHISAELSGTGGLMELNKRRRESKEGCQSKAEAGGESGTSLQVAFLSQQQLHSFNRPYQLGFDDPKHYADPGTTPSFDHPLDANVTGFETRPGDLVIVATDGLFDNVELDEVCALTAAWEEEWHGGPNEGLPLSLPVGGRAAEGGGEGGEEGCLSQDEREQEALSDLGRRLCVRARELSLDKQLDSPFATLAKENDILWSGGMPDDCTVVCLRVVDATARTPGLLK